MDRPTLRQTILEAIARRVPAPTTAAQVVAALAITGCERTRDEVLGELQDLEARGYLLNLKHRGDPVYRGITPAATDQLDRSATKLDPALHGDLAL